MDDIKESLIRAVRNLTKFDIYEIFESIRDLPHHEAEDGYYFDLDSWNPERINALWASVQERRKRINDVWRSEMTRNDFLGSLSVQFAPVRKPHNDFTDDGSGRRVQMVHVPPRQPMGEQKTAVERLIHKTSRKLAENETAKQQNQRSAAAKKIKQPTLNAMIKKRRNTASKAIAKAARGQKRADDISSDDSTESSDSGDDLVVAQPISDDDEDWSKSAKIKEDFSDSEDDGSMDGLF